MTISQTTSFSTPAPRRPLGVMSLMLPVARNGLDITGTSLLLYGPPETHKTDLIIQSTLTLLNEDARRPVLVLAPNRFTDMPIHVHSMPSMNPVSGSSLELFYIFSASDVIDFLDRLRLERDDAALPQAIMLCGMEKWCNDRDRNKFEINGVQRTFDCMSIVTKILTLVSELAAFINRQTNEPCFTMFSYSTRQASQDQSIPIISPLYVDILARVNHLDFRDTSSKKYYQIDVEDRILTFYHEGEGGSAELFLKTLALAEPRQVEEYYQTEMARLETSIMVGKEAIN